MALGMVVWFFEVSVDSAIMQGGLLDSLPKSNGKECGRDEVRGVRFVNAVVAAHGGRLGEAQLRRQLRSEVELRNEG